MTFRRGLLISLPLILSGCQVLSVEQQQQTLDAINQTNKTLDTAFSKSQQADQEQQAQLTHITKQLAQISAEINSLHKTTPQIITQAPATKEVIYVEKAVAAPMVENKALLGEQEWVWIDAAKASFQARIDTGATTSSISATEIQEFERDGKTWVKFNLAHMPEGAQTEPPVNIEAPVRRWVKIRQASTEELERRPVIELRIKVGNLYEKTQFTLANRSHMEFPVLLGREYFKDIAVVDVSKAYIHAKHQATPSSSASQSEPTELAATEATPALATVSTPPTLSPTVTSTDAPTN